MITKYNRLFSPAYSDDFFNDMVSRRYYGNDYANKPAANIIEKSDAYIIEVAAAGWSKEDINISLDNEVLTIKGERKEEEDKNKEMYKRQEFNFSSFSRSFKVDESIDRENIIATHENGVLKVHLPLKEQEIQKGPRSIDIK